jgi:hypothetical protein
MGYRETGSGWLPMFPPIVCGKTKSRSREAVKAEWIKLKSVSINID